MDLIPVFKLLSDETRLRVILLLSHDKLCVCELCGILEEPQPKISKILAKLRDLNLVVDERKEKYVFYTLNNNNSVLESNIQHILDHITEYPNLQQDQIRLTEKENHIDAGVLASITEVS